MLKRCVAEAELESSSAAPLLQLQFSSNLEGAQISHGCLCILKSALNQCSQPYMSKIITLTLKNQRNAVVVFSASKQNFNPKEAKGRKETGFKPNLSI